MSDEGLSEAAEVGGNGWDSAILDCKAKVNGGGALGRALLANGLEELGPIAKEELWGCCWIPENIAETAESYAELGGLRGGVVGAAGTAARAVGCSAADAVPVGGKGLRGRRT